ncbi:uncharacterized protein N7483_011888 [Penicillium malachiteum]|uniref:uncharacterized protein n=1 Tax=Penicillium malachiteum TaxID=1324776 RepID=UPI00254751B8|nr:uncharacterized protein N7483_011888 [Penicillium malachiteum]KAJ5714707.1 hypothetical protein N7483_011888 [Penicillium malachiteum]
MEQGDRQAIHPFFHQVPKHGHSDTSQIPPETPSDPFAFASSLNQLPENKPDTHAAVSGTSTSSKMRDTIPSSPEGDPNAGRRKRRKTEKARNAGNEASLRAGLSGWLGKEIPPPVGALQPTSSTENCDLQTSSIQVEVQHLDNNIAELHPIAAYPVPPIDETAPKRKIVKLNLNGRLLSSPPLSPPGTAGQNQGVGKRGRPKKSQQKLISIKYNPGTEKNIAQMIGEILDGKIRHSACKSASKLVPKSSVSTANAGSKKTQTSKPTHPFFMKKPASRPQTDSSNASSPGHTKALNTSKQSFPSFSLFDRPKVKFPELIDPLWPSRDFVHVYGIDTEASNSWNTLSQGQPDQKKAKVPLIRIPEHENAVLASTASARTAAKLELTNECDSRPTLRLPTRHKTSGKVLQRAAHAQMSSNLPNQPAGPVHPSISKSQLSLSQSLSAFDNGKYETQLWAHKYAPKTAEDVLQVGPESRVLRDWLNHLKITAVDTGKSSHESKKKKSKREKKQKAQRKADKLDGFIVSSEEEASEMENLSGSDDELAGDVTVSTQRTVVRSGDNPQKGSDKVQVTNAILLSGPSGCGKTASVYAVAKELDFEVFEISPGSRRSARDMLEKVGDMTQNHLVHLLHDVDESSSKSRCPSVLEEPKQNKLMGFFKGQPSKTPQSSEQAEPSRHEPENDMKRPREQKQSLILLEEADILFEEDRNFWTGVFTLISQSRRPIVITCNEESLVPIQDMSLHAILRFQKQPPNLAVDYMLMVAASEGHVLKRDALSKLYDGSGHDLRRSLNDMNFWCQMGVGSDKAGLDWFLPLWPPSNNVDTDGDQVRVLSFNTYEPFMGWLNRDLLMDDSPLEKEIESLRNTFHWWRLGVPDLEDASGLNRAEILPSDQFAMKSNLEKLELLKHQEDYSDSRSSLDMLSSGCWVDTPNDFLDTTVPPMPEAHRSNYIDSYPLLQTDLRPKHSTLDQEISFTHAALLSRHFRGPADNIESTCTTRIFNGWTQLAMRRQVYPSTKPAFQHVFGPIMRARPYAAMGRLAPSFESSLSIITEDLAPYIRGIMTFDARLKQYRDQLYSIWVQEQGHGDKRARTTRASRAALEGSDKAYTRKERWFPDDTNYFQVQCTGMPEWQNALYQMGHFHVQPAMQATHAHDGNGSPVGHYGN